MADLSLKSGITTPAISLNSNSSSGSVPGGVASSTIKIIQDIELTAKEQEEMILCGLNPKSHEDIVKFQNLTVDEKTTLMNANTSSIPNQVSSVTPENHEEHHHVDIQIDKNSPEWQGKSDAEKLQFVLEATTKAQIGEDKWNSLTEAQRKSEVEKSFSKELNEHIPGWDKMSSEEKLDKMSDIITHYSIAKNADMSFSELMRLAKNNPEQYQEVVSQYYADGHVRVDLKAIDKARKDQCSIDVQNHNNQFREFCGVKDGENVDGKEYGTKEYEFLSSLDPSKLTGYQKSKLEVYKGLEQNFGKEVIAKLELGNKDLYELLSEDEINALSLVNDDNGISNRYNRGNQQKIQSAVAQKLLLSKTPDEIQNYLKGLSPEALSTIMAEIGKSENEGKVSDEFLEAFKEVIGTDFTTAVFNANDILTARGNRSQRMQSSDAKHVISGLDKLVKEQGLSPEIACEVQRVMTSAYERPYAVQAQVTAGEMGVEEYVEAGNKGIVERDNAKETFEDVNEAYANSNNISDEMKQFYAQNSIEVIKSPEDRQAQADSLGKYNLESFDKGVQKGYENIANGTASGSKGSSTTTQNNVTNPITNNSQNSQILLQNVQDARNTLVNYGDVNQMPHAEAVKMFQRMEPAEQKEFLSSLSPQQVSQIPITVCNAFPELINTFIDLGKGVEIIQQCNVNTGNRTIQLMAKSKGAAKKQFNEWAANHLDRLAKCTYDDLIAKGEIRVNENKAFTARG